jgi:hypothetical protein
MKMGSPMTLTFMKRILQKIRKSMRLNTFTAMKETLIRDEAVVYGINPIFRKKRSFVAGFAANSISDAAQALLI